jgi:hypothetical protein
MTRRERILWSVLKWQVVAVCLATVAMGVYRYNSGRTTDGIIGVILGLVAAPAFWWYMTRIERRSPRTKPDTLN